MGWQLLNQPFIFYVFLFPSKSLSFLTSRLQLLWGFLCFFASRPPSTILSFASRPWVLVLIMMRRSQWGVGFCGFGFWLLVGVARLLAYSSSPPPSFLFSSPFPLPFPLPCPLPFSPPSLPSCSSPSLVCVCVCVYVIIELHITAQSGPVILVVCLCVCVYVCIY